MYINICIVLCCVIKHFGPGTRQIRRQTAHTPPRLPHPELDGFVLQSSRCRRAVSRYDMRKNLRQPVPVQPQPAVYGRTFNLLPRSSARSGVIFYNCWATSSFAWSPRESEGGDWWR